MSSSLLSYLTIVVFLSIIAKEYAVRAFVPPASRLSSCSGISNKRTAWKCGVTSPSVQPFEGQSETFLDAQKGHF